MHCTSGTQISQGKNLRFQLWHNQNQFLQKRHGNKKAGPPETILVGLRFDEDGFDLLSWVVNVAARPGDFVIALHVQNTVGKVEDIRRQLQFQNIQKLEAVNVQFQPLRDLCSVKKVHLDVQFEADGNMEKVFIKWASTLRATMLVVSTSRHHVLWYSQKRGRFLARHVPATCSVAVVKNYKVLFYREKVLKELTKEGSLIPDVAQMVSRQILNGIRESCSSLQNELLQNSLLPLRENEDGNDLNTNRETVNKIWLETGDYSPREVLEGPGLSSESDGSSPSSSCSNLSHSLSKKALLSYSFPYEDCHALSDIQPPHCFNFRRKILFQQFSTFPAARKLRKFSGFHCSMRHSLKACVTSLWNTEAVDQSSTDSTLVSKQGCQSWKCFNFEELFHASNGFDPENMVGKGGHAEVYRGSLKDGRLVAIKRLLTSHTDEQKERNFLTELGIVSHVSHPNTTPLIGVCIEKGLHLIFNLSLHGNLESHLHGIGVPVLEWVVRYKVAVGTARGLHYLHTGCRHRIIHRDIKSSNILLGQDFEPQISDFGLAKWLPDKWTHHSLTPVEGTFGYLAPEYLLHGIVDEKTDIFAFGVLLLELITGREPIDSSLQSLVIWARPFLGSLNIKQLADPKLAGEYDAQEMQCIALVSSLCIHQTAACRPNMSQVLQMLTDDDLGSDYMDPWSITLSQSIHFQDYLSTEEYSCSNHSNYLNDLNRHREVAFQF